MLALALLITGLVAGAAAGWVLRPLFEARVHDALPMLRGPIATVTGGTTLAGRIDAQIAEIEAQIRGGIDSDRNATRLQILRDVKDGD